VDATGSVWRATLVAVFAVSLLSFSGVVLLVSRERFLRAIIPGLVSFAVGALLGDALLHILPELAEEGGLTTGIAFVVIGGILGLFVLEKFIHLHHSLQAPAHRHLHPVAVTNLVGDGIHNLVDGAILAGAFLTNTRLGVATAVAVALHEIPQEIGDLGVLVHAGLRPRRALVYNFASALVAVVGAALTLALEDAVGGLSRPMLALSAGAFIYIAGSDLIPELHRATDWRISLLQFSGVSAGFAVMAALLLLE